MEQARSKLGSSGLETDGEQPHYHGGSNESFYDGNSPNNFSVNFGRKGGGLSEKASSVASFGSGLAQQARSLVGAINCTGVGQEGCAEAVNAGGALGGGHHMRSSKDHPNPSPPRSLSNSRSGSRRHHGGGSSARLNRSGSRDVSFFLFYLFSFLLFFLISHIVWFWICCNILKCPAAKIPVTWPYQR